MKGKRGVEHIIEVSRKMETEDAVAYLDYHRHMQAIKLKRLEREVNDTKEAIRTFEEEIKRRKRESERER